MTVIETRFRVHQKSKLSGLLEGRDFKDENEFLELIEDYLFGKMIEAGDTSEIISEKEVFSALNK